MTRDERASRLAEIDALRERIDEIDARLVSLLSERAGCALAIGQLKRTLRLAIYQPAREADVIAHVCGENRGPLDDDAMRRLFERIIDEARRLEREASRGGEAAGTVESED
jgi:chorismate mutase